MKRLHLLFIFSLFCFSPNLYASCFNSNYFNVFVPNYKGGIKFMAGGVLTRAAINELDFAATTDDVINYRSINPNYDWNYEFGIGYNFACSGNDAQLNYSYLTQNDTAIKSGDELLASTLSALASAPFITDTVNVGGIPGNFVTTISPLITPNNIGFIQGKAFFKQHRLDLELGQSIHLTRDFRLKFLAGISFARLHHQFISTVGVDSTGTNSVVLIGQATNPVTNQTAPFLEVLDLRNEVLKFEDVVNETSDFNGIGPQLGLEANYYLDIGISFFAKMSSALFVGQINSAVIEKSNTKFFATIDNVTIVNPLDPSLVLIPTLSAGDDLSQENETLSGVSNPNKTRIVPNLEAKLGISYALCLPCTCSRVFLEGGYMVSHYFDGVDKLVDVGFIDSISSQHVLNYTFDGLYFKVEMHV